MKSDETEETRLSWNRHAAYWDTHVDKDGDSNRILNSDPVLWRFAGDVKGLTVLDAGCGNGYLSIKLHDSGANVIGIDFSDRMIDRAQANAPHIDFRVDSCSELKTVCDDSIDMVIANYVLMDTPDLDATMRAFDRVLRAEGVAIVIFSHPCFPQGAATVSSGEVGVHYHWSFPYFQQRKCNDLPWGKFKEPFKWFHRPLSDYWKAFMGAGFEVVEFEEPRIAESSYHLAKDQKQLYNSQNRPCSVAFKLRKKRHNQEVQATRLPTR